MERTQSTTPKYAVNVTHHGLHLLFVALDLAIAVVARDENAIAELGAMFERNIDWSQARKTSAITTRRAISEAHRDAVKVDGHGSEFQPAPLEGEEFADAMSDFDAALRRYDRAIAESIELEAIEENEEGKREGNLN